jgi:hypothetical protein
MSTDNGITEEKLGELEDELDAARAAVFVCATALDEGDDHSDLELQSATMLKQAYKLMDGVYDELVALRIAMVSRRLETGKAEL